jgi:L-ascorbate metabolism protein UlaG (beta-lactamase superfamily)
MNKIYPHRYRGRFYNYEGEKKSSFFLPSLYMLLQSYIQRRSAPELNQHHWYEPSEPLDHSMPLRVTWIGHSTFLIQIGGYNILTDPIFGDLTPFFKRILPPGIPADKLPAIDFVIISHNHRDHMDSRTLYELKDHPATFLVPKGDKAWFSKRGFERVRETMWWDRQLFTSPRASSTDIEFTFLPAFHWARRGLFDYNTSLWGSWLVSCNGIKLYFAGDTAYSSHFSAIANECGLIDVALMPIGPCEPREWMSKSHIGPEEAGQAFLDLGARHFIPMHWGTYHFGTDHFQGSYERILTWWGTTINSAQNKHIHMLKVGQQFELDKVQPITQTLYQREHNL